MRILIAGLWAATQPSGICRTIVNLVRGFNEATPELQVAIAIGAWQTQYFERSLGASELNAEIIEVRIRNNSVRRNWWYMFELPKLVKRTGADLLQLSFPAPVVRSLVNRPVVTTVHDLYPYDVPANFGYPHVIGNRLALKRALRASDQIACVSGYTLTRVHRTFPLLAGKVRQIANPIGTLSSRGAKQGAARRPFFLAVAQHRANKNLDLLLRSFHLFCALPDADPRLELVIVGACGPETRKLHSIVERLGLQDRVRFLSNVGDPELAWMYQNCELFVTLSGIEGYGLPLGEALSHGARVVASDIPAHREVGAGSCEYIALGESDDSGRVAIALSKVSSLDTKRAYGWNHPSPAEAAQQYCQVYSTLLRQRYEPASREVANSSVCERP